MYKYLHKYLKYKSKFLNIKYGGVHTPPSLNASRTPSSVNVEPPTPKIIVEPVLLSRLIPKKDELVCILSACSNLSQYKIKAKNTKMNNSQLYINFEKEKEKKDFAHFSFHYPIDDENYDEDSDEDSKPKLYDIFESDTFHLKLDIAKNIVFNLVLEGDNYKLKSKLDDCQIISKINQVNFNDVKKIIECFEIIFNSDEYKKIFKNPAARKLLFN